MKPKRTILCVDDNEQSLSIRKVMLETRGYRVLAFSDAQQALDRFAEGGVDLVLTDLVMPGVDGSKLIEGVKARSPETPAILLSGKVKVYEHETNADVFWQKACTFRQTCWNASGCCSSASAAPNAHTPVRYLQPQTSERRRPEAPRPSFRQPTPYAAERSTMALVVRSKFHGGNH